MTIYEDSLVFTGRLFLLKGMMLGNYSVGWDKTRVILGYLAVILMK